MEHVPCVLLTEKIDMFLPRFFDFLCVSHVMYAIAWHFLCVQTNSKPEPSLGHSFVTSLFPRRGQPSVALMVLVYQTRQISFTTFADAVMPLPVQINGEKDDPASKEAERFESFYQGILELHEVLERVENFTVRRRMREIISRIEGT